MTAARPLPLIIRVPRLLALWFLMGGVYYVIEVIYRFLLNHGSTHWTMWIVGGLCGVVVGGINQIPRFFRLPIWKQSLIGTLVTLSVELVSGLILNRWLGLGIWDYTGLPGNVLGQICLPFAFAWFLLMPFAIWIEDTLRWGFGWNGKRYGIGSIYKELAADIISFFRKEPGYKWTK